MGEAVPYNEYPIVMEVADWTFIDATMDNEIQDLREQQWESKGAPHWVKMTEMAESIRQAGWDQLPDWPETYDGLQSSPPPGMTQAMKLTARQWGLVVSSLERWATVGAEEESSNEATSLRIAALIRDRFTGQATVRCPPSDLNGDSGAAALDQMT